MIAHIFATMSTGLRRIWPGAAAAGESAPKGGVGVMPATGRPRSIGKNHSSETIVPTGTPPAVANDKNYLKNNVLARDRCDASATRIIRSVCSG